MNSVKDHYGKYPETPENLKEWLMKKDALFKEARSKIVG
jgi:hypothetical protein